MVESTGERDAQHAVPDESLDDFLVRVNRELAERRADGSIAPGVDRQFERNFAAVRGDASLQLRSVYDALDQISLTLETRFDPSVVSSRIPGGGLFHRVVGRLTRRHISPAYSAIDACRLSLVALTDTLAAVMTERSRDVNDLVAQETMDRLATIDSLEADVAALRALVDGSAGRHES